MAIQDDAVTIFEHSQLDASVFAFVLWACECMWVCVSECVRLSASRLRDVHHPMPHAKHQNHEIWLLSGIYFGTRSAHLMPINNRFLIEIGLRKHSLAKNE